MKTGEKTSAGENTATPLLKDDWPASPICKWVKVYKHPDEAACVTVVGGPDVDSDEAARVGVALGADGLTIPGSISLSNIHFASSVHPRRAIYTYEEIE